MNGKAEIISGSWNRVKNWVNKRIRIENDNNIFVGLEAGNSNIAGLRNSLLGYQAGYKNTGGYGNTSIGHKAGYSNITGHYSTYIGNEAGYYETVGSKLFIDDRARTDEADGRIKALIYGLFDAATANQLLRVNGILELTEISDYANNAAAITGGLTTGQVYRNGDSLNIVH